MEFKRPPTLKNIKKALSYDFEKLKNNPGFRIRIRIHRSKIRDSNQSQNLTTFSLT